MSTFRMLTMMPLILPCVAFAGLGYIGAAAWHGTSTEQPDISVEAAQYGQRPRMEHGGRTDRFKPTTRSDCRAIDGDTLRCGRIRIRLLGMDAAELPGHCAVGRACAPGDPFAQKRALAALVGGTLTINQVAVDRWHRSVAQVTTADGTDLSCAMLAAGAIYKPKWDNGYRIARTCPSRALRRL